LGIRKNVTVDTGLDINKILLVGLLVFTLVGSIGLFLPENLAFAGSDKDNDNDKKDEPKEQLEENTAHIEAMSADFDLFKLIAAELNELITNMNNYIEDLEQKLTGVEAELQKEIQARETSEAAFKAEIDAIKTTGDIGLTSGVGSSALGGGNSITSYKNMISGEFASNIASDESTSIIASCDEGDAAVSGGFTPISANFEDYLTIFRSELSGDDSWKVDGFNEDPLNSIQIEVFVNCLSVPNANVIKSAEGSK